MAAKSHAGLRPFLPVPKSTCAVDQQNLLRAMGWLKPLFGINHPAGAGVCRSTVSQRMAHGNTNTNQSIARTITGSALEAEMDRGLPSRASKMRKVPLPLQLGSTCRNLRCNLVEARQGAADKCRFLWNLPGWEMGTQWSVDLDSMSGFNATSLSSKPKTGELQGGGPHL